MEEIIAIPGEGVILEGRYQAGSGTGGAVISHPHPLYGGDMDNNVVWTAARAFQARGGATLRFNFRGVGGSTGEYGEGLAEVKDVAAALAYLQTRCSGPYLLVGYSFGAAVVARAALQGVASDGLILISPPIAFMDLAFLIQVSGVRLMVAGDRDELCPAQDLQALAARLSPSEQQGIGLPPNVVLIPGGNHFYGGFEQQLYDILKRWPLAGFTD